MKRNEVSFNDTTTLIGVSINFLIISIQDREFGFSISATIIIIVIQPLSRFGQRPERSQSTGIALVRCILGKFLGVVCHCFPPRLDVHTFATRCLNDARDPSGGRWNCGRECCSVILPKWRLPHHLGIFYMPQIYDMGPTALLPLRRKACWGFFRARNM